MPVRQRHVFYFPGFDPASTARYRRLFAVASERFGVETSDLGDGEGDGWAARRMWPGGRVETRFRYLRYDDLVRDFQAGGVAGRIGRGLRAVAGMALDGAWFRIGWRPLILALSPALAAFTPIAVAAPLAGPAPLAAAGVFAALMAGSLVLLLRMRMLLASDLVAYLRVLARPTGPAAEAYEARLPTLAAALGPIGEDGGGDGGGDHGDGGETLVVGHSLGGVAAIRALAAALDDWPEGHSVGLLTLGSVHGLVLAQRGAGREALACAVARLSRDPRVTWVDVSSPRDAFTIPLTDPLLLIGDRAGLAPTSPRVISARLARAPRIPGDLRTLFPAMRRHMGYLLAAPECARFDYADWVTGAERLADRAAGGNSPKARMRGGTG